MSEKLKKAIEQNDSQAAQNALAGLKNINQKITREGTALLLACEQGADKVVPLLLDAGATFNSDSIWDHPFGLAAFGGHHDVLTVLVARNQVDDQTLVDVLRHVGRKGPAATFEFILKTFGLPIDATTVRMVAASHDPKMIYLLAAAGADLNATEDLKSHPKATAPLHHLSWDEPLFSAFVGCKAQIDIQDSQGRTPLMLLMREAAERDRTAARSQPGQPASLRDTLLAIAGRTSPPLQASDAMVSQLLKLDASAKLKDRDGNDALDYYRHESLRIKGPENAQTAELLKKVGAFGSDAVLELAKANPTDIAGMKKAIAAGADVNRRSPCVDRYTPLIEAALHGNLSALELLLDSGADPNRYDGVRTPLIHAAEQGYLPIVQRLIDTGADIHARELQPRDEEDGLGALNAYEAAELSGHKKVVTYLKSLGAARTEIKPLQAGVHTWNDFVELLAKGEVHTVAKALAKLIDGKMIGDAYGKSIKLGKQAFVVARPKGMDWCNVLQVRPPPSLRETDPTQHYPFYKRLAKAIKAPVFWAAYSDTSDATGSARFAPDETVLEDHGEDYSKRAEMLRALGSAAAAWMKKKTVGDEQLLRSPARLDTLAKEEKMVIAAFSLAAGKTKTDIEFPGLTAEMFDAVAVVSD